MTPGCAYRVNCYRQTLATRHHLSEWHATFASALAAYEEHRRRPWDLIDVVPQCPQVPRDRREAE